MWALSIVLLVMGLFAVVTSVSHPPTTDATTYQTQAIAQNFVDYRNAVIAYAEANPLFNGAVPSASLPLPPVWIQIGTWNNNINAHLVLAWGAVPPQTIQAIQVDSQYTQGIGVAQMQGPIEVVYTSSTGTSIPIPLGSVPLGDIASAVVVQ